MASITQKIFCTDSIGSAQFTYGGGAIVYVADALNEPKQFFEDDISLLDGEKAQEAVIWKECVRQSG